LGHLVFGRGVLGNTTARGREDFVTMLLTARGNVAVNLFRFEIRDVVVTVVAGVQTGLLGRLTGLFFNVFDDRFELLLVVGLLGHIRAHNHLGFFV